MAEIRARGHVLERALYCVAVQGNTCLADRDGTVHRRKQSGVTTQRGFPKKWGNHLMPTAIEHCGRQLLAPVRSAYSVGSRGRPSFARARPMPRTLHGSPCLGPQEVHDRRRMPEQAPACNAAEARAMMAGPNKRTVEAPHARGPSELSCAAPFGLELSPSKSGQ